MLTRIIVRNFVLIEELEIGFSDGLNVITGETGAGKSILLGAFSLFLGQRADSTVLLNKNHKCVVEGHFDISRYGLEEVFKSFELDYEPTSILRREISGEGKSRAFINDTPVTLSTLKEISEHLVDIHSQHENLLLTTSRFQLSAIDAMASNETILEEYRQHYRTFKRLTEKIEKLKTEETRNQAEQDYIQFQFDELQSANLIAGELEGLEQERDRLDHASEILQQLAAAVDALATGDENISTRLQRLTQMVNGLVRFDAKLSDSSNRLQALHIELKDIAAELELHARGVSSDPDRLQTVESRLDVIYSLLKKHRQQDVDGLIALRQDLSTRLSSNLQLSEEIERTLLELAKSEQAMKKSGDALSTSRAKVTPQFEKSIRKRLGEVAMPHAELRVQCDKREAGPDGFDAVRFLFSANKGGEFRELSKAASGGEMSRLMLCIKSLIARQTSMPTVIFDEIDTGISGETAARVGSILQEMSEGHQLMVITHLPQIASKGNHHYKVIKETRKNETRSMLICLDQDERVKEVARMLSGEDLSTAALENARVLIQG
ncbi:MAG: DNA repair protein RecN [Sphingobacteriales bacterium]|nr:DNA repair protein RecN [Sphingobacteriales bacterium]